MRIAARKEQELGGGWCEGAYKCQGRWLTRVCQKGALRQGGTAASATGSASQ